MNKQDIELVLKRENAVKMISKLRTQFSPSMTEFYFFRTFFETLRNFNIRGYETKDVYDENGELKYKYSIILSKIGERPEYISEYNLEKLHNDLNNYNNSLSSMGMIESANALIDIFIGLLED